jgi:hypothetical protein
MIHCNTILRKPTRVTQSKLARASVLGSLSAGLMLAIVAGLTTFGAARALAGGPKPPVHAAAPVSHAPSVASHAAPAAAHAPTAAMHSPTAVGHSPTAGAHGATPGAHPTNVSAHSPTPGAHGPTPGVHGPSTMHAPPGGSVHATRNGGEVARNSHGQVTGYRGPNGHEAHFDSHGGVREVRGNGMVVRHGPGGVRHVEMERADHSRLVAYGHGRGFIEHRYVYGGHPYYARAYYYHGAYYRGYYRGYYYHGAYLYGYRPAYFYPPVYYGWAYNPWPAPVPYAWGWGPAPWYGYYGAYYQPYPVYPSPAYWIADYAIGASLAEAYAAGAASAAAELNPANSAHLVYASYSPTGAATAPAMTKDVKDAVAREIQLDLAAEKNSDASGGNAGTLDALLADGKPHVFIASTDLTVTTADSDCGLTEGDVLSLDSPPAASATSANVRILASKHNDCAKGATVPVEIADLQEMHNHLLSNIDKGMAQMKDHPGQGGLPAPPADAIAGTKQAPYAAAAPPADANGGAELDQAEQQGAQLEQQVVAEANAPEAGNDAVQSASAGPIGQVAPAAPAHRGPTVIALGQTPEEVIAMKGQPTNKVAFPNKTLFIYPDMKITFQNGKLSDVQ